MGKNKGNVSPTWARLKRSSHQVKYRVPNELLDSTAKDGSVNNPPHSRYQQPLLNFSSLPALTWIGTLSLTFLEVSKNILE